jgi:hypothetical protein
VIVVMASYVQRPREALVPPPAERERVASVLRRSTDAVTERFWMFAALDPGNPSDGRPPGHRERRVWRDFADRRMQLLVAADDVVAARRGRPRWLYP